MRRSDVGTMTGARMVGRWSLLKLLQFVGNSGCFEGLRWQCGANGFLLARILRFCRCSRLHDFLLDSSRW